MKNTLGKLKKVVPFGLIIPTINVLQSSASPSVIATRILNWIVWIAGAFAIIYLIYGGIIYLTSAGNEEKTKAGKSALISAIIGLIIIVLAYVIISWVYTLLSASPS